MYFLPENGSFTLVPLVVEQDVAKSKTIESIDAENIFIIQFYEKNTLTVPHKITLVPLHCEIEGAYQ